MKFKCPHFGDQTMLFSASFLKSYFTVVDSHLINPLVEEFIATFKREYVNVSV